MRSRRLRVHVNGKYNVSKLRVLLTVWYFCTHKGYRGLSLAQIETRCRAKHGYLLSRLPMFANTNHKWAHAYLKRRWSVARGYPEYEYSLTSYGLRWLEKVDSDIAQDMADSLSPIWSQFKNKYV